MKTKTLLGAFLLSMMAFYFSACQDDTEIILFNGSQFVDETGTRAKAISTTTLYLNGQETADIGIANGKGGYSAQSLDEAIVTATVNNDRLLLNSHGKKGNTTVTVSDKKGNSVVLPVTVTYGVVELRCNGGAFVVCVDGNILRGDDEQKLIDSVNEAMLPYAFIENGEICVLQPKDINKILVNGVGEGAFIFKSGKGEILAEGTYKSDYDDEWITGKQQIFFNFSYQDSKGVAKYHKFYYEPKLKFQPSTRDVGPVQMFWAQDVTHSSYLKDITLPDNGKVLYMVVTTVSKIKAAN